jgi:hypothetical protein
MQFDKQIPFPNLGGICRIITSILWYLQIVAQDFQVTDRNLGKTLRRLGDLFQWQFSLILGRTVTPK